jgi:hypothetical protein
MKTRSLFDEIRDDAGAAKRLGRKEIRVGEQPPPATTHQNGF